MLLVIFSVKDKAADAFIPPFFLATESMAIREFLYAARQSDHKFALHPHDYSLYKLGVFDDATGQIKPLAEPLFLVAADGVVADHVMSDKE